MNRFPTHRLRRERGASLMVALIFLVIMAMLGMTIARVTGLEERGASNTRDRDLALQAAEAALRDAQVQLADAAFRATPFPNFNANNANNAAYWDNCFEAPVAPCDVPYTPAHELPTLGAGAVHEQPQYVIERKPDVGSTKVYRVTARGVGGQADTIVILQAEYGF